MRSFLKVSCFGIMLCFCGCDSPSYMESNTYSKTHDKLDKSVTQSTSNAVFLQQSMKNSKKSNKKNKLTSEQVDQVFMNRPSKFFTTGKVLTRKAINKHIASKIDRFLTVKTPEIEKTEIQKGRHYPFEPKARKAINEHNAAKIDRFLTVRTPEVEWTDSHDPLEPKWWQELRNGFGIRSPVEPKWEKITRRRENGR